MRDMKNLFKGKNILVTGASGFVGSRLVERLEGMGAHVFPLSNSTNSNGIRRLIRKTRPFIVYHLSTLFIAEHAPKDIPALIDSNITFGTELLEALKDTGAGYFVNAGTYWTHYEGKGYDPVCLYAATKKAFEDIMVYYAHTSPIKMVTLELSDTYGPGDKRKKLMNILDKATRGKVKMTPGLQSLDLIHINDAIDAFIKASGTLMRSKQKIGSYAVRSGKPVRLRDLAQLYSKTSKKRLNIIWGGRAYRQREMMSPDSPTPVLPGWRPKISLAEGLRTLFPENV